MLSYVFSSASSYFHLPVDGDDADLDRVATSSKHAWASPLADDPDDCPSTRSPSRAVIYDILAQTDLYRILGVQRTPRVDTATLRRAYLARSRACHPDKFPGSTDATRAFQKVSVAYDVLSSPASRRAYDARPPHAPFDLFAARPADATLRDAVLGVLNDLIDGDLDVVRAMLHTVDNVNPALHLGEDGIDSVLRTLHAIRQRALTCRTCIHALHHELTHLAEVQRAVRALPYLALRRRTALTLRLARLTLALPIVLERALVERDRVDCAAEAKCAEEESGAGAYEGREEERERERTALLNARVYSLLCALVAVLERMEGILK
ncbi:DnaJ-domain-containing protein [Wolfiporia cocos MD-104 SS10]|uniref:DnaJ-domain-containing protein n=1 Tax=Wolfiporia cocos (strain MD-104) TaxID=742152 RepID=A0A2H3JRW0_WOLCO|nr:DnaJ-domain-containing protein [Wolfiporia cocos MD-104 SS10]